MAKLGDRCPPRPWRIDSDGAEILIRAADDKTVVQRIRSSSVAEFIVAAVNAYEDLDVFVAGRFVLVSGENAYVTSFDTWAEAEVAFDVGGETRYMPGGFRLEDGETGRIWYPGARYEWEDAAT